MIIALRLAPVELMYVCVCTAVTEREIVAQVKAGATTYEQIQFELGVGTCCGQCKECACELISSSCTQVTESLAE